MIREILPPEVMHRLQKSEQALLAYEEIRLRVGIGVSFFCAGRTGWLLEEGGIDAEQERSILLAKEQRKQKYYIFTKGDMDRFLEACSRYSLYAYREQMAQGFLTLPGGHRVGFGGSIYKTEEGIQGFTFIGSANIRIAHEKKGCAKEILPYLWEEKRFRNTLIIGCPGCGKTTVLRDLIRTLSNGTQYRKGQIIGVSDERGELAASDQGVAQMDLGKNTDILEGGRKKENIWMLVRTMTPQIIAMDEIGEDEIKVLRQVYQWGVGVLATVHGVVTDGMWKEAPQEIYRIFECFIAIKHEETFWEYEVYDREGRRCKDRLQVQ